MPAWYAKCEKDVRSSLTYWAALGTFFFDDHQFEASARALLEAVYSRSDRRLSACSG